MHRSIPWGRAAPPLNAGWAVVEDGVKVGEGGPKFIDGSRRWVYPLHIFGQFAKLRRWTFFALQAFFFVTPWLTYKGLPVAELRLGERRLYALGHIFTAQDTIFILLGLLGSAFTLFLMTALWGRVWCGYACPQTVFLDGWVANVERWIEGDRPARRQLDAAPWTGAKIAKKGGKWAAFAVMSLVLGMTGVSWFTDTAALWTGQAGGLAYAFVGVFSLAAFLDFTWFREQFCNFLCPYARFQGALSGANSFTVTYDVARGEPRKKGKRTPDSGACIDCDKCVAVCPQGIDIRDGFQLECIACTKCVDACTSVMTKFNQPSLVRYSTVELDRGGAHRWVRPRVVLYSALIVGVTSVFGWLMMGRHEIQGTVNRAPGSLFTIDEDGWVRNTYLVHVVNNRPGAEQRFSVAVDGLPQAEIIAPSAQIAAAGAATMPLVVRVPPGAEIARTTPLSVVIQGEEERIELQATFKSDRPGM
ncbi:MAG: putative electron transport protein YccM [Pseudomonadota bacterium]